MAPAAMKLYAELCGETLARAHARSGDPVAIAAYLGNSDTSTGPIAEFAEAYAQQAVADHARFLDAIDDGAPGRRGGLKRPLGPSPAEEEALSPVVSLMVWAIGR